MKKITQISDIRSWFKSKKKECNWNFEDLYKLTKYKSSKGFNLAFNENRLTYESIVNIVEAKGLEDEFLVDLHIKTSNSVLQEQINENKENIAFLQKQLSLHKEESLD